MFISLPNNIHISGKRIVFKTTNVKTSRRILNDCDIYATYIEIESFRF